MLLPGEPTGLAKAWPAFAASRRSDAGVLLFVGFSDWLNFLEAALRRLAP